ncbi:universal stress protein [Clostridium baratii]
MKKKKILIPIDGSERSLTSLNYLKNNFNKDIVEVNLIHVREIVFINGMAVSQEIKDSSVTGKRILNEAKAQIKEYECKTELRFGYAADEILAYADENKIDTIIMAKNTKKKFTLLVGSVTAHIAKKTKCALTIIPEIY